MASTHLEASDRAAETARHPAAADRGRFYTAYAALCLAIAVVGFAPSFWAPVAAGSFNGSMLVFAHGIVFTAWPLLFLAQTLLVERGRVARHRAWGVAGVSLATLMVAVGLATVGFQLSHRLAAGYGDAARSFALLPFSNVLLFAGMVTAALLNVRRPDWHKRLMMIASAIVLLPAFARFVLILVDGRPLGAIPAVTPPADPTLALRPGMLVLLLMLGAAWLDRRKRGDWHPAWAWGIGIFLVVAVARVPLAHTKTWHAVADALVAFG